jgi:hypothetical protein
MVLSRAARRRAERESAQRDRDEQPVKVPIDRQESAPNLKTVTDEGQTCEVSCPISISSEDGGGGSGSTKIPSVVGSQSISIDELHQLWNAKEPVTILDVRTDRSLEGDLNQAKGALRMPPDHIVERAKELGLKKENWLIAYCA